MSDSLTYLRAIALLEAGATWQQTVEEVAENTGEMKIELRTLDYLVRHAGIAPVEVLRTMIEQFEADHAANSRVELAAAAPRATLRLVVWLPIAGLVLGQVFGLDALTVLGRQPIALVALCLGGGLLLAGQAWSQQLMRMARGQSKFDRFPYLLLSSCLQAGYDLAASQELVQNSFTEVSRSVDFAADDILQEITATAKRTGSGVAELITAFARIQMHEQLQLKLRSIETLSVRMMLPLGVAVLPAFVLMTVVPLSLGFISKTS